MATKRKRSRNFVVVGKTKVRWSKAADGRTFVDARKYGRKLIAYKDHDSALIEARKIAIEIHNGGAEATAFTADDRAAYAEARAAAAKRNVGLVSAITEWADCRDLLEQEDAAQFRSEKPSLRAIVEAGIATLRRPVHKVPDVVAELLLTKSADLDQRYSGDLKSQLKAFAQAFPKPIDKVTASEVQAFLSGRRTREGAPLSAKRFNHWRNALIMLFKFARGRKYLPDVVTAAQEVEKAKKRGRRKIGIFTAEEINILMKHVPDELLAWQAIAAFSGVRTEEIGESRFAAKGKDWLRWEDFDWTAVDKAAGVFGEIIVRSEVSKTGKPRRCPILANLYEWLQPWRDAHARGLVVPGQIEKLRRKYKAHLQKVAAEADEITERMLRWPHNALRHSYGSYRMAIIKDMPRLAYEMGNTVGMIQEHYHNPRPPAEAAAWFNVIPHRGQKVIQLDFKAMRSKAG